MADADYDEFGTFGVHPGQRPAATLRGPQGQTWVRGAGALTSVALIVGLGVWAYDLAVRDVRGVPVIQALEG
ncbi:MAG: SPOR domain-containing protein, partial [Albidovulum sp.]